MYRHMRYILPLLLLFLSACDVAEETQDTTKLYYDVNGFVLDQISELTALKPSVKKTLQSDDETDNMTSSDINWKRELELFVQADINKPAYKKSYAITRPDSLTYAYTLATTESLPVKRLMVRLDSASGKPSVIQAHLISKNKLYVSEKHIELSCAARNGKWILSGYRMNGFQQLLIQDPKRFDITGKLL